MSGRYGRTGIRTGALIATITLAIGLGACGGDSAEDQAGEAQAVEKAFLTGMTHHHGTAIEMAEIAQERGQSDFVKGLAEDIVSTQSQELDKMKQIYDRLIEGKLEPDPGAHDGLGLSAEEAGMTHTTATNETLRVAKPFDRAFVDEMVPHHAGALRMTEVLLESTQDRELRRLAEGIISAQTREIEEMNAFRTKRYGAPVPDMGTGGQEHGAGHSG